jgi:hypothetical protein
MRIRCESGWHYLEPKIAEDDVLRAHKWNKAEEPPVFEITCFSNSDNKQGWSSTNTLKETAVLSPLFSRVLVVSFARAGTSRE